LYDILLVTYAVVIWFVQDECKWFSVPKCMQRSKLLQHFILH